MADYKAYAVDVPFLNNFILTTARNKKEAVDNVYSEFAGMMGYLRKSHLKAYFLDVDETNSEIEL